MKSSLYHVARLSYPLAVALAALLSSSYAASYYWDSNGTTTGAGATPTGTWGTSAFWSTSDPGTGTPANTAITVNDDVFFAAGTDAVNPYTVTVNGSRTARLVTFQEGTVTISGGTGLTLAGGGGVTITTGTVTGANISSNLTLVGGHTFNVANSRTLTLGTGSFTRSNQATLNVLSTGTVTTTMSGLNAAGMTNGIIGAWATHNVTTSSRYATINGSNNIVAYTSGTAAATAADLLDTTGAVNYDLAVATGTMPDSMSANTIRYTGGAATTVPGATLFSVNGLLNASASLWTISTNPVTIGATRELVVNTPSGGVTISSVVANNSGGSSSVTKSGTGTLILSNTNTYSGNTTINAGTLNANSSSALGDGSATNSLIFGGGTLLASGVIESTALRPLLMSSNGTINTNGFAVSFPGNVSGTGWLTKSGNGTLTLSGANSSFAGTLNLSAGVVRLDGASARGTASIIFNSGVLGLGPNSPDFTSGYNATQGAANSFSAPANFGAGWAAYGGERIVNVGGAGAAQSFYNGKPVNFGAADADGFITYVNGKTNTTVTRLLNLIRGTGPIDVRMVGVISENAGALTGLSVTGNGIAGLTANNTFTGNLILNTGATIIGNNLANAGVASSIGQGSHGITLNGGTFRYGPVVGAGGTGATINRNFFIAGSGTLDASGTGPLVLNQTGAISADVDNLAFTATGANNVMNLAVANPNLSIGMRVSGSGVAANTTITGISGAALTLSSNVTATTGTATFGFPTSRTLTLSGTNSDANTIAGILQNSTLNGLGVLSLTKTGAGRWQLTGANTLTGPVSITGGTLALAGAGSLNDSSGIAVNGSGAKFVQNSSAQVLPLVSLTQGTVTGSGSLDYVSVSDLATNVISNNDGVAGASITMGTLDFSGAATVNTTHTAGNFAAAVSTSNLFTSAAGVVTINPSAAAWTAGTYALIGFNGAVGGEGAGQFALGTVSGLSVRQSANMSVGINAINLNVVGENPYWSGDGDGKWNTTASNNWKLITAGTPTAFVVGDISLFNDNATGTTSIDIDAAPVAPASTIFQNNTLHYTLSSTGGFGISTGTLTKTGTGSLTITTANTYTGATVIGGGTVTISGAGTLGLGSALNMDGGQLNLGGTTQTVGSLSLTASAPSGATILNGNLSAPSYGVSNASGSATISASLVENGAAGLTKTGSGELVLAAINTYTGGTTVTAGTLTLANASALGAGTLTMQGGSIDSALPNLVNANNNAQQWNGNFTFAGTNSLDLGFGPVTTNGARAVTVAANTLTVGGTITPSATVGSHITKLGAGTLALTGTTALGNNGIIVNGGIVRFNGTLTTNSGAGAAANTFRIGNLANASAAWVQTGGNVTLSVNDADMATLGNADASANAFGSMTLAGGTFTAPRINVGGSGTAVGTNGVGILNLLNGSSTTLNAYFIGGRGASNTGSATIAGGSLNLSNSAIVNGRIGAFGGGRMEVNIGANLGGSNTGASVTTGSNPYSAVASGAGSQGIVNLLGGTLTTNAINSPGGTSTGTGINQFNFNGGTLRYSGASANATFFAAIPAGAAGASGAFVRSGGMIVDSNGQNLTIATALLAPTGGEITSISVTGASTPGTFFTAPYVRITGGNNDATAIATIKEDGSLDSIIVTNPGSGYSVNPPTVTLVGGTHSGGAGTVTGEATAVVGASTSGGFTKKSGGYLILSGNNTYSGVTTIEAGAITLNSATPNPNTSYDVKSGAQAYGGFAVTGATFPNNFTLAGIGFVESGINVGALRSSNNQTFSGTITLAANARIGMIEGANASCTFSGQITGDYALAIQGAFLTSSTNQTITFANTGTANNYAGNTTLSTVSYNPGRTGISTILSLGANEQIPHGADKGNLVLSGPNANNLTIFELNGRNETLNGLSNSNAAGAIVRNTGTTDSTLTIGGNDTSSSYSGAISDSGSGRTLSVTKIGLGTLIFSGTNSYIGATSVTEGTLSLVGGSQASPITVSAGASLAFTIGSPTTSTSTFNLGAGKISVNGLATANSHTLITSSAGITGTPVLDFPIDGYELKVEGNSLLLVKAGYASWAAVNAIDSLPGQDKDGDGVSNAIEYVLGGTVTTNDLDKLPSANASGANVVFTFRRNRESIDGATTVQVEVGTTLNSWPSLFNVGTTTANSSAGVTVAENTPAGFDTITVTVPKGTDTTKFGRLKVTVP